MWNPFKTLTKNAPTIKDISRIPSDIKDSAYNIKANKITIRYFMDLNFTDSQDITGELVHNKGLPIVIFERPFSGAILFSESCVYRNHTKDGELTMDLVKDYPFGIDHKSDLFKYNGIEYTNNQYEIRITDKSLEQYYSKKYKFYIPIMLNRTPIPIIRLDKADRILNKVDEKNVKRLSNITQTFLREFTRLKLLERTGTKKDGVGWILFFGWMAGLATYAIVSLFVK